MPLTDVSVRRAKASSSPQKLADGGGLYLLVSPSGGRYWRMDYRWAGKRRTLAFGVYPTISLAEAREKREQAKKHLAIGIDPGAQRKLARHASAVAATNTFRVIAEEWLDKLTREGRAKPTLNKTTWLLSLAIPHWANSPSQVSLRRTFLLSYEAWKSAAVMKRQSVCEALADRFSGMPSRRDEPSVTHQPTCAAR